MYEERKRIMKMLKKTITFVTIISLCLMFMPISTFAMENEIKQEKSRIYQENEFKYPEESEFTITRSMSYIDYSSGPMTSGYVLLRFTNVETGSYCTHSFQGSNANGRVNCNISIGTYRITQVGGSSGLVHGYFRY